MIELQKNLWDVDADIHCITTNCAHDRGRAMMGGGVAREALNHFPGIDLLLGRELEKGKTDVIDLGYLTSVLNDKEYHVVAFPTMDETLIATQWRSTLKRLHRSFVSLQMILDGEQFNLDREITMAIPRPGCGIGGLDWEKDVKLLASQWWGDNVTVVYF